jgi:hypothetical protein
MKIYALVVAAIVAAPPAWAGADNCTGTITYEGTKTFNVVDPDASQIVTRGPTFKWTECKDGTTHGLANYYRLWVTTDGVTRCRFFYWNQAACNGTTCNVAAAASTFDPGNGTVYVDAFNALPSGASTGMWGRGSGDAACAMTGIVGTAKRESGSSGSTPFKIKPDATTIVSPASGKAVATHRPTLTWNKVTGADRYELRADGPESQTAMALASVCGATTCELAWPNDALYPEKWTFRVRVWTDPANVASDWSAPLAITLNAVPPVTDAERVGARMIGETEMFVRDQACPNGVECLASDINRDGRVDFVQIDRDGILGAAGNVWVSYSNGWTFLNPRIQARCTAGELCRFAVLDDDVVLLRFRRSMREVWKSAVGDDHASIADVRVHADFCGPGAKCFAADVTGDGKTDLIAIDPQIGLSVSTYAGGAFENAVSQTTPDVTCLQQRQCFLGDLDGDRKAELIMAGFTDAQQSARPTETIELAPGGKFARRSWGPATCQGRQCFVGDIDGDGLTDLLILKAASLTIYRPQQSELVHAGSMRIPTCATSRCFLADASHDGRFDWWQIDVHGTIRVFPNDDSIDRLERAVLALTTGSQDYLRYSWSESGALIDDGMLAWDPDYTPSERLRWSYPPRPQPAVSKAAWNAERTRLLAQIDNEISLVLGAVPPESTAMDVVTQRRWQRWIGKVVAARAAVLAAPRFGSSRYVSTESCGNIVLHDRYVLDDGAHLEGSYLSRYYDALRAVTETERVQLASGALTGISEGFRCLSQAELAVLDTAFSDAVAMTMRDLLARGQPFLARRTLDRSLPILLLTFDAVHHFRAPASWRLLVAKITGTTLTLGAKPTIATDYAAAAADLTTVVMQLYRGPHRASADDHQLTLDEIGLWLPDIQRGNRLARIGDSFLPEELLRGFIDMRNLGEGDCQLYEVIGFGMKCPSAKTCGAAAAISDPDDMLLPGDAGDEYSHFFTRRSQHRTNNNCDSPGSPVPPGLDCVGVPARSTRGRFSRDPEIDRLLSCTMEALGGGGTTTVAADLEINSTCLVGQPDTHNRSAVSVASSWSTWSDLQRMLSEGGSTNTFFGRTRDDYANLLVRIDTPGGGTPLSLTDAHSVLGMIGDMMLAGPAVPVARSLDGPAIVLSVALGGDAVAVYYDPEALASVTETGGDLERALSSAYAGAIARLALKLASDAGRTQHTYDGNSTEPTDPPPDDPPETGDDTQKLCTADTSCGGSCGMENSLLQRMTSCLEQPAPVTPESIMCEYAVDYCANRPFGELNGALGSSCMPPVSITNNSDCFAVNCSDSGPITSACCGAFETGAMPEIFVWSPDPGPMPPPPAMQIWSELPFAADPP